MPNHRPFIDVTLLPPVSGLEAPTVGPHEHVLLDDDEKMCRVIEDGELRESYVDDNINTYHLRDLNWLTLAVDKEIVDLVYFDGRRASTRLGSISLESGQPAKQYGKKKGVIYPIDDQGNRIFDDTNTPNLTAIRRWYLSEAKRAIDRRVEIAEIVHVFAKTIGASGSAGR